MNLCRKGNLKNIQFTRLYLLIKEVQTKALLKYH